MANVTTSASRPSMTARAWLPELACDCSITTCRPVVRSYSANELRIQFAPQLAGWVVGDVEQFDPVSGALGATRLYPDSRAREEQTAQGEDVLAPHGAVPFWIIWSVKTGDGVESDCFQCLSC